MHMKIELNHLQLNKNVPQYTMITHSLKFSKNLVNILQENDKMHGPLILY
jgi:hypothetical protein